MSQNDPVTRTKVTLNSAHDVAGGVLADAARGTDPVAESKTLRVAPTVSDLANRYSKEHTLPMKLPNSLRNDRSMPER